jgi:general secretion pathway protein J
MRARGFTLLEVMVAISIFALIGIASYRVLTGVMQTNERLAARAQQMRGINRALWILQQDIEQLVQRNVRGADGAISATANYLLVNNEAELPLQFTRGGRSNPLGLPRSALQRVAYRVDHHPDYEKTGSPHYHEQRTYLLRYSWPMLDGSGAKEKAQLQILLPDIDKISASVLTRHGPEAKWPAQNQRDLPLALQLELITAEGESIKHSYKVW